MADATFKKMPLSGSTHGRGIKVVATATLGTTIHQAINDTTDLDEVYLWAFNTHTADVVLTLEWGGVTDPDDLIEVEIPKQSGLVAIVPGCVLRNNLVITAFAAVANVVTIHGFVHRIENQ
jgi:hypothetical protein